MKEGQIDTTNQPCILHIRDGIHFINWFVTRIMYKYIQIQQKFLCIFDIKLRLQFNFHLHK